jgi:hypothetical protein
MPPVKLFTIFAASGANNLQEVEMHSCRLDQMCCHPVSDRTSKPAVARLRWSHSHSKLNRRRSSMLVHSLDAAALHAVEFESRVDYIDAVAVVAAVDVEAYAECIADSQRDTALHPADYYYRGHPRLSSPGRRGHSQVSVKMMSCVFGISSTLLGGSRHNVGRVLVCKQLASHQWMDVTNYLQT